MQVPKKSILFTLKSKVKFQVKLLSRGTEMFGFQYWTSPNVLIVKPFQNVKANKQ